MRQINNEKRDEEVHRIEPNGFCQPCHLKKVSDSWPSFFLTPFPPILYCQSNAFPAQIPSNPFVSWFSLWNRWILLLLAFKEHKFRNFVHQSLFKACRTAWWCHTSITRKLCCAKLLLGLIVAYVCMVMGKFGIVFLLLVLFSVSV